MKSTVCGNARLIITPEITINAAPNIYFSGLRFIRKSHHALYHFINFLLS